MLSMGEAARLAGISKATLSRAISKGRVSAVRNDKGGFDIDPAELFRVYPHNAATVAANGSVKRDATPIATADETAIIEAEKATLQAEINGLRAQLDLMRDQADDLKSQRDGWQRQAEASQRLLADHSPKAQRGGFFGLFRKSA